MAELTGVYTVLLRDLLLLRKKWLGFVAGNMVGPLLYLMAFGWGLGRNIQFGGASYLDFVVPGIVALSAMNGSYNATGTALNISRLYHRSLEEFLTAPVSICSIVLGYVLGGCARGPFSAAAILILSYFFGAHLHYGAWFFIVLFLTCFLFAALGVVAAMMVNSHEEMARFGTFVILPMSLSVRDLLPGEQVPACCRLSDHDTSAHPRRHLATGFCPGHRVSTGVSDHPGWLCGSFVRAWCLCDLSGGVTGDGELSFRYPQCPGRGEL